MKVNFITFATIFAILASCTHKPIHNDLASTTPRDPASTQVDRSFKVYPSYNQMRVAKEIIGEAMKLKRKSMNAKKKETKKKYWEKFVKKFNKIDTFVSVRTIRYTVELNAGIYCDGSEYDCSSYNFYEGSVCYKGEIGQALQLINEEFAGMGDEEIVDQFAISGDRITYMFIDQPNEWTEEGSLDI
jgi:hypothetical protein